MPIGVPSRRTPPRTRPDRHCVCWPEHMDAKGTLQALHQTRITADHVFTHLPPGSTVYTALHVLLAGARWIATQTLPRTYLLTLPTEQSVPAPRTIKRVLCSSYTDNCRCPCTGRTCKFPIWLKTAELLSHRAVRCRLRN